MRFKDFYVLENKGNDYVPIKQEEIKPETINEVDSHVTGFVDYIKAKKI